MTTELRRRSVRVSGLALLVLAGCSQSPAPAIQASLQVSPWELPASAGASQPDLSLSAEGTLLLSWVQQSAEGSSLSFARSRGSAWDAPRVVAQGDYFGSSLDSPHVRVLPDGTIWAQWLRKSTAGKHARDVVLAHSGDGGAHWSLPQPVNLDATATEHGFVAMWPADGNRLGIAWLDGRDKQAKAPTSAGTAAAMPGMHPAGHDMESDAGATMLRASEFDADGARQGESVVDARTCDCCQTDVAVTTSGPVMVYRDRAADDTRDIVVTWKSAAGWSAPRPVHADGWIMTACPMNGPGIAATGNTVAVAWYTAAGGRPSVRLALSRGDGETFAAPVLLAQGASVRGNVDVQVDDTAAWASWLAESAGAQVLRVARVDLKTGALQLKDAAKLSVTGRVAAPRLALRDGVAYLVWEDRRNENVFLTGVRIALRAASGG
jgi:hypothetical protein